MSKVLDRLVYQKGGWVLHMLRKQVGTETFWSGIREYYRTYRNASASTADLERVMEQVSGQDLAWFFRQWLYRPGSPVVRGTWRYDAAAKTIQVVLNQVQAGDVYRLPLEIGIKEATAAAPEGRTRIERLDLDARQRTFTIRADRAPLSVELDPNTWTLMEFQLVAGD
jgi:aminopeptidase N